MERETLGPAKVGSPVWGNMGGTIRGMDGGIPVWGGGMGTYGQETGKGNNI